MSRYTRLTRSVSALHAHFGDEPLPPAPLSRTGELVLTPGQKQALIKLRGNDLCTAILDELRKRNAFVATTRDNYALEHAGLAINKGSFHIIAPAARWRTDQIVREYTKELGLHVLTYDYGATGINARAGFVSCCCGWRSYESAYHAGQALTLGRHGAEHLLRESVKRIEAADA